MNRGQCLPTIDGYKCLCMEGYTGHFCEISKCLIILHYVFINTHLIIKRSIHAHQIHVSHFDDIFLECFIFNYIGSHGGVCYDLVSSYMCACPDGSFRSQCLPIKGNDGEIYNRIQKIFFIEADNFSRKLYCPCENGGDCTMISSQPCVCPIGYTGRFCETASGKYYQRKLSFYINELL